MNILYCATDITFFHISAKYQFSVKFSFYTMLMKDKKLKHVMLNPCGTVEKKTKLSNLYIL